MVIYFEEFLIQALSLSPKDLKDLVLTYGFLTATCTQVLPTGTGIERTTYYVSHELPLFIYMMRKGKSVTPNCHA